MFAHKMILFAINNIKFVLTKQILKENLPRLEQPGKVSFSDES